MRKTFLLLWLFPVLAFSQLTVGGGGVQLDDMLPVIADSSDVLRAEWVESIADSSKWTDGSTVNAIKPKAGKTVEADSVKAGSLEVTGNARFNGNVTLVTTASESLIVPAGGIRNEGGLLQKGLSQFGATATPVYITADGKVGIGTATSSPYNAFGLVSSTSGQGTGIGLTSAKWNKKRTDWVTASDTSAIGMYIDSAGGPRLSMKAVDGDTVGVWHDGIYFYIKSLTDISLWPKTSTNSNAFIWDATKFYWTDDTKSVGGPGLRFQNYYGSDNIYLGGKGQTATIYISKEATIAGADSSMMFRIGSDGNPYMRWAAADADSARLHVRGDSTEFYSKNALVLDAPVTLIGGSNVGVSKIDTVFTDTFVPRWLKITSGAKSWYSPVYADTTGKW